MTQIVVYGLVDSINSNRVLLSDAIHGAVMAALDYPVEKRFHRFIPMEPENFIYPSDRGNDYTIIEVSMFEGRSSHSKRHLIDELFRRIDAEVGISPQSVEITITETPKGNWGIRGVNADELLLDYEVEI